jgi:RHS repeat-associated protein
VVEVDPQFPCCPRTYSAITDADGYYTITHAGLPPLFGVFVSESGRADYDVSVFQDAGIAVTKRVTVHAATISQLDFTLGAKEDRPRETAQGPQICQNLVGNPINVTTGNMYTQQEDLASPSAFGRFAFTRTYNSQSTYAGPLGLGWTHPFTFELTELQSGAIRVRNGEGNVRFYELVSGSTATYRPAAPARDTSILVKHAGGFTQTERNGLRREFDPSGRALSIINRAGWQLSFGYTDGFLTAVTDPGGRTLSFSYTNGKLTRVEGPGGLVATYAYDAQGQLVGVTDALGTRWTYAYSDGSPPRLTSVRDANGSVVEKHSYDDQGRVIFTWGAGGLQARTLEYVDASTTRVTTQVTDSFDRVTTYHFGIFGDLPLITQIQGPCPCGSPDSTFDYDAQGRPISQVDAQGRATTFAYDADGNLVTVTDALKQVTALTYNAFGQVLTTTDPTGATTTFAYEETTGFLLQVTNALGHTTTLASDANNLPGAITDPRGNRTTFLYASTGLLSAATDPTGATATFSYDPAGRPLETRDALGGTIRSTYDLRGRPLTVTDPLGAATQFHYDLAGNRVGLTDPNRRVTSYTYDAANRLIAVADAAGGTTSYSYDTEGNLLSVTDTQGQITAFAYDAHNRLVRRTDSAGASETFSHDPVGNLLSHTDRKGRTITFLYDALNRLTQKDLPDGTTVSYTYDALGRLLTATDLNGPLVFTYDLLGRVQRTISQDSRTLNFTYDPAGNRIGLQDEAGHVTSYTYDPRNLLATLTDPRTGGYGFAYDPLGRRSSLTRPNGTITTYGYDAASRVVGLTHSGRKWPFEALSYSYDPSGNRITDTRNETKHQYAYDPLDQLTQVQMREHRARWKVEEAYAYDPLGNRLTGPDGQGYQYDAANRLTQDRAYTYAYDANGNLVEKVRLKNGAVTTYAYDPENRLIRVVTPRTEVTFQYDPLGRRTEKRVIRWEDEDGDHEPDPDEERPPRVTRYLYDHEDILVTFGDTRRGHARYVHGPGIDEPLAEARTHHTRFYHADGLGSVIAITGEHGHRVRDYRYSAFGVPADHRGDAQPYRFTGREWDKEIDLYYYRARYYSPLVGRFLGPDPIPLEGGARSLYAYVGNNPVNFVDPTGQFPLWLVPIVLITFLLHHGEANAPGPGDPTLPATDATGLVVDIAIQVTAAYFAPPIAAGVWWFCRPSVVATRVANPVPKILARVIPGKGPVTALGRPGAEDVFVTAAEDIAGLNAQQLAQRLGVSQSKGFTVIEFPSAGQPIASPINRLNPGFSGGGRTVGGAREYVIPNQPIPPGAWSRIVE